MQIYGATQVHGAQAISAPHANQLTQPTQSTSSVDTTDTVQFSAESQLVAQANELPEIRQDRVDSLRAQIQSGQYETADRFEGAVEQLLNELM
ncbi:MAG: flagellar biosynthesis anti-sigma factor FlgM [Pirellulales bacterium]|nr:flagellar biosynthesis anti-sigma factor FlgM [Pirellulales bacterium]